MTAPSDLEQVSETLYLRDLQEIQGLLAAEADIASRLTRLQDQDNATPARHADMGPMQSIGADMLWDAWVARMTRQLNMELAQIRAQKIVAMQKVRKAFGRKEAISWMAAQDRANAAAVRQRKAEDQFVFQNCTPPDPDEDQLS